jgi:AAA15 family ATPase/GTPase
MDMIECDYDSDSSKGKLASWIQLLQERVAKLENHNKELQDYIQETKASTETETNKILGRAMTQCEKDPRTYRKINALVVDTIFPMKKFVKSQDELDDFNAHNGLGMVIMAKMKVEKPDRLQFWNAYKEIVADAIATRRTTTANELKKVIMSKFRLNDIDVDGDSHY